MMYDISVLIQRDVFLFSSRNALSLSFSFATSCVPLCRIRVLETECQRKLLRISYLEHKTNDWVRSKINLEHKTNDWVRSKIVFLEGPQEPLLATVKRRKLAWFRHVTHHDSLSQTTLQGILEGRRRRGRQRKCWMDKVKECTTCPRQNCLQRPPAEKTGSRSLLNRLSCPSDDPVGQGTESNCLPSLQLWQSPVPRRNERSDSCKKCTSPHNCHRHHHHH